MGIKDISKIEDVSYDLNNIITDQCMFGLSDGCKKLLDKDMIGIMKSIVDINDDKKYVKYYKQQSDYYRYRVGRFYIYNEKCDREVYIETTVNSITIDGIEFNREFKRFPPHRIYLISSDNNLYITIDDKKYTYNLDTKDIDVEVDDRFKYIPSVVYNFFDKGMLYGLRYIEGIKVWE